MYLDLAGISNLNPGVGVEDITDAVVASGWMPPQVGATAALPSNKEALVATTGIIPGSEQDVYLTDTGAMVSGAEVAKTIESTGTTPAKWYTSGWFIGGMVVLTASVIGGVYVARRHR